MSAFIELHDGILLNLNIVNFNTPASSVPVPKDGKKWSVITNGQSIQITDEEYNIIKNYYKSSQELY